MSHVAARLHWRGYKQILAPSLQAEASTPHFQFISAQPCWPLLYKFRDCTRLAEDKADTTSLSLALALVLVKPLEIGTSGKAFRDSITLFTQLPMGLSGSSFRGELERTPGTRALPDPPLTYSSAFQVFQEGILSQATRGPNSHKYSVKLCSIYLSQHNVGYLLYC